MPHQLRPDPDKLNINFTMFEANRVHPEWIRLNRSHDLLILPTESSRRAWEYSGMPTHRIRTCPLGVDPSTFFPAERKPAPGEPRVRFLNVSEYSSRKNLSGLLRAWIRATRPDDDTILTIKSGMSLTSELLPNGFDRAAPVVIQRETLADSELPFLYRAATHYVSASFGEGWDQPMMEAAATGLKLIAPDHSAYREYLDENVATMIPARQVPVVYESDPETARLFDHAEWWEPDEDALVESIRAAIEQREPLKGSMRDRIMDRYTWNAAALRLIEILTELEPLAKKRRYALALVRSKSLSPAAKHFEPSSPPDSDPA
jgi:glycosyltransferase involved in cell wall biosynthesis